MGEPTKHTRQITAVRTNVGRLVRWAAFVGGGLVTPKLAAKAATRLWQRLPSNAGRRKDNRPSPGRLETIEVGLSQPLAVERWGDAGPLVYLVHGWGGWRGQVASFVTPLVDKGFQVVAADAFSHGDSPAGYYGATHSCGGEMIDCFQALVGRLGQPYGIIGHSLGCANAARAIVDGQVQAERLVMVAASPEMRGQAQRFGRALGFSQRTTRLMVAQMENFTQRTFDDFNIMAMAATGLLPPGLVIHDQADKEAPYQEAVEIAEHWPKGQLLTTHGLGHHRILIDQAVIQAATDFIAEQ